MISSSKILELSPDSMLDYSKQLGGYQQSKCDLLFISFLLFIVHHHLTTPSPAHPIVTLTSTSHPVIILPSHHHPPSHPAHPIIILPPQHQPPTRYYPTIPSSYSLPPIIILPFHHFPTLYSSSHPQFILSLPNHHHHPTAPITLPPNHHHTISNPIKT